MIAINVSVLWIPPKSNYQASICVKSVFSGKPYFLVAPSGLWSLVVACLSRLSLVANPMLVAARRSGGQNSNTFVTLPAQTCKHTNVVTQDTSSINMKSAVSEGIKSAAGRGKYRDLYPQTWLSICAWEHTLDVRTKPTSNFYLGQNQTSIYILSCRGKHTCYFYIAKDAPRSCVISPRPAKIFLVSPAFLNGRVFEFEKCTPCYTPLRCTFDDWYLFDQYIAIRYITSIPMNIL